MAKVKQADASNKAGIDAKLSMDQVLKKINKTYGDGTIARSSQARALSVPRLETGIFGIDYATGGGWGIGRINGIYGLKSSGKTLVALKTIATAQRYCRTHLIKMKETDKKLYRCLECGYQGEKEGSLCPDCKEAGFESKLVDMGDKLLQCPECNKHDPMISVFFDAEGTFENYWASKMGVNCHYVFVIRTEYAEQAIDISDTILRNGKCDLLVVDTLAHLIPTVEIEESATRWQVGVQARLINKMLRKIVSAQNTPNLESDTRPTALLLNQVRMKVGVLYGNPETKPGGMGQDFATSIDIRMWPGKYEKDADGNTLNIVTNFRCVKNKISPAQMDGNFRLWLRDYGNRTAGDTEDKAVVLGQAFKHGWLGNSKEGWGYLGNKFKTKKETIKFLLSNRDVYEELRTGLFSDMLGTIASDKDALKVEETDAVDIGTVEEDLEDDILDEIEKETE
jgi:recombination protein RecA